jgi:phosphoribosylformylglycinamidine cyclo-ligase
MNYKDSGVNLHEQDIFNAQLANQMPWLGGFAGAFNIGDDYLVSSTDGVGTKIKLYNSYKDLEGVSIRNLGIDLVGMVMNDIVCTGAKPLFFNDYLAVNTIESVEALELVAGINEGLAQCGDNVPLLGGETAIMSDMYKLGDFDIAGFGIGACPKDDYIDGANIAEHDVMIGLKSSGFHSNGYTLIRKIVEESSEPPESIIRDLLKPTKIYVKSILKVLHKYKSGVHGIAHITGGGRSNVDRLMGEDINLRPVWFDGWSRPDEFDWIQEHGNISDIEMRRVFNDGIGMVLIVTKESAKDIILLLEAMNEKPVQVGLIKSRLSEDYNDSLKG